MFIPEEELGENYLLERQCSRQQGVTLTKVDFDPAQRKSLTSCGLSTGQKVSFMFFKSKFYWQLFMFLYWGLLYYSFIGKYGIFLGTKIFRGFYVRKPGRTHEKLAIFHASLKRDFSIIPSLGNMELSGGEKQPPGSIHRFYSSVIGAWCHTREIGLAMRVHVRIQDLRTIQYSHFPLKYFQQQLDFFNLLSIAIAFFFFQLYRSHTAIFIINN